MKINLFTFICLLMLPASKIVAKEIVPQCEYKNNFIWSGCSFPSEVLESPILDLPHFKESERKNAGTDFKVVYKFYCNGHSIDLDLSSGNSRIPIRSSVQDQSAVVPNATKDLVLKDFNQELTARKSFRPNCKITILSVSKSPSIETIENWKESISDFILVASRDLSLLELANRFENLQNWDTATTKALLEAIDLKILRFQELCHNAESSPCLTLLHLKSIQSALVAKIEGANTLDFDHQSANILREKYSDNLDKNILFANNILDFLRKQEQSVQDNLRSHTERIHHFLSTY